MDMLQEYHVIYRTSSEGASIDFYVERTLIRNRIKRLVIAMFLNWYIITRLNLNTPLSISSFTS
jgi:hypothetical protein